MSLSEATYLVPCFSLLSQQQHSDQHHPKRPSRFNENTQTFPKTGFRTLLKRCNILPHPRTDDQHLFPMYISRIYEHPRSSPPSLSAPHQPNHMYIHTYVPTYIHMSTLSIAQSPPATRKLSRSPFQTSDRETLPPRCGLVPRTDWYRVVGSDGEQEAEPGLHALWAWQARVLQYMRYDTKARRVMLVRSVYVGWGGLLSPSSNS